MMALRMSSDPMRPSRRTGPAALEPRAGRRAALRVVLASAAAVLVAYAAAAAYLWTHQRTLIFLPAREVLRTPGDVGLRYEEVRIPVPGSDGAFLHGWWIPSGDPAARTVLYLHGNDLNIGASVEPIARLCGLGLSVLVVDYRGYGKSSDGPPNEARVYEDAGAAWRYLIREKQLAPGRTFIYGHSLGGAIALDLASSHPEVAGVIVESAFTSMRDVAAIDYWMFPVDWMLDERFDAIEKARKLRTPVLYIHGTADREVPYAMSERLYEATNAPKRLLLVPGGGHEDSSAVGGEAYANAVRAFVGGPGPR